jgi:hypothetical protein
MSQRIEGRRRWVAFSIVMCAVLLAACSQLGWSAPESSATHPSPTVAAIFSLPSHSGLTPTTPALDTRYDARLPVRRQIDAEYDEIVILDDTLLAGWSAEQSSGVRYDLQSRAYAYSGGTAVAISPLQAEGVFRFTVSPQAAHSYERERVIGVSVRLNGGPNMIEIDDLAMVVEGSNASTYWVKNDTSVAIEGRDMLPDEPLFSPTRLYFLGVNHTVAPNTWFEVVNWLDDRIYDPEYRYITAIDFINDGEFLGTYYIDRVVLLVQH